MNSRRARDTSTGQSTRRCMSTSTSPPITLQRSRATLKPAATSPFSTSIGHRSSTPTIIASLSLAQPTTFRISRLTKRVVMNRRGQKTISRCRPVCWLPRRASPSLRSFKATPPRKPKREPWLSRSVKPSPCIIGIPPATSGSTVIPSPARPSPVGVSGRYA